MGMYDSFGKSGVQLKAGLCNMDHYHVGDTVTGFDDGVYIAPDGIVVIKNGVFVAEFPKYDDGKKVVETPFIIDKWGTIMPIDVSSNNPFTKAIEAVRAEIKT